MDRVEIACELYKQGQNTIQIGKQLGLSYESVRQRIVRGGMQVRSRAERQKKYKVNDACFREPTSESMYYAGFLFADGNVSAERSLFQMELMRCDEYILTSLKCFLGYEGPVERRNVTMKGKTFERSMLRVTSPGIVNELSRYGVIPKKSKIAVIPEWIVSHPLAVFFLRGVFDGDGSVGVRKSYRAGKKFLTLAGTPSVVTSFKNWMTAAIGTGGGVSKTSDTFWILHYAHRDAEKVGMCLYKDPHGERLCRKAKYFLSQMEQ